MGKHSMVLELYYSGAWVVAPVLESGGCKIMRGVKARGDSDPAYADLTIDNRSNLYAPRAVSSSLFGKIGQNTPARITIDGAVRLVGEVASWVPGRPIKGPGWTRIRVAGVLQRIGRGKDPLDSAIYRSVIATAPQVYVPVTDGKGATVAADFAGGSSNLAVLSSPVLASVAGRAGTSQPELISGTGYAGGVAGVLPATAAGAWTVEFGFQAVASNASTAQVVIAQWRTDGTFGADGWWCYASRSAGVDGIYVGAQHSALSGIAFLETGLAVLDGRWHQVRMTANQDTGTQVTVKMFFDGVQVDSFVASTWTVGAVNRFEFGDVSGVFTAGYPLTNVSSLSVSDFAFWSSSAPASTAAAFTGYDGEVAATRFTRLCTEQGITATVVGAGSESAAMGPQLPLTMLDEFDELARTDDASIFETRTAAGLTMRTGASKLNQAPDFTISYIGQIRPGLEPIVGDEGIRNDVTAQNPAGTARRVQQLTGPRNVQQPSADPNGVGRYQSRIEVNPYAEGALADSAGWWVNLGTFDGVAYAEITADLDAAPSIAAAVAALDIGDCLAISQLPVDDALDTVECLIIGIEDDVQTFRRFVTFYCVPAAPYQVGLLALTTGDSDPFLGHLDPDGSVTVGVTAAGAASFSVATASGPIWTTVADDFPLDVIAGGQRMSISAVAGGASPQTFTVQPTGRQIRYSIPVGSTVMPYQPIILSP